MAELRGSHCKKYLCPTKQHTFRSLCYLSSTSTVPHLRFRAAETAFFPFFHSTFFPASQILCLGSVPFLPPSKSFFLSLSLWQVSHSIARKEADVPNLRYTPDPSAFYLTGIRRFQNRHFLMEQILSNTYLKKKTNKKH